MSMKKTAAIVIILTILSKLVGFVRELSLSYFYGAHEISDAYIIATTIPGLIFSFFGVAITTTYIPIYNSIVKNGGYENAEEFTNKLIKVVMLVCTLVIITSLFFTEEIVKLFASGFHGEVLDLTIQFTKISIFAIYFSGLISIFTGYMHIRNRFIIPIVVGMIMSFLVIVSTILSSYTSLIILPIGTLVATASQVLILIPYAYKDGFKFRSISFKNNIYLKKMLFNSLPVMLGISVNQINILVDRTIASRLVIGGISALNYANKVNMLIQGVFVLAIVTVMYPNLTLMFSENKMSEVKRTVSGVINAITFLVLPATFGIMVFSEELITLMYGRGSFDAEAIKLTATGLYFYSIGMLGFGIREAISRVFYSMQDTKTPMINATIGMIINIILNIILSKYLGIGGLALATSIAALFTTFLLFIALRKKIGPFGMKQISISFLKILFASLVMGGLAKLSFNYLTASLSQNLSLLMAIGVGAVSYFVIIYFMKIEDVDVIVGAIKKKFGRGAA